MSEKDFREQAKSFRRSLDCRFYIPDDGSQRPILEVQEALKAGPYEVEPGRWTDGGSIPSVGRSVVDPLGFLFPAFLVHDVALFDDLGWDEANRRFNEAMKALGAPAWKRLLVLGAVEANGKWQTAKARLGLDANHVREDV